MCEKTGHKIYWEDWEKWKSIEDMPYELQQRLPKKDLDEHRMASAYWERMSLNSVTQGSGIVIMKIAMYGFFKWLVKRGYFNKVKICNIVHDEACIEYPEEAKDEVVGKLIYCMEHAAGIICKKLPIPAEAATGTHWIH